MFLLIRNTTNPIFKADWCFLNLLYFQYYEWSHYSKTKTQTNKQPQNQKINTGMNSITEYDHFPKMTEGKILPSSPTSYSCTNTNVSLLNTLQKENWYEGALGSFPTDLCLSLGILPNQPMAKVLVFNRQHWFYCMLPVFWGHKEGFLIDWIYIKTNHFKTTTGRIKNTY